MIMSEPINWCNLKKNIKHIGEVSTSRQDGKPTGAEILTSTNEVTNQVRDTLEGKLRKMDAQFQDRFATLTPIEWAEGINVTNPLQVYKHTVAGVERTYLPDPAQIPFTTRATFAADEALNRWVADDVLTRVRQWRDNLDIRGFGGRADYFLEDGTVNPNPTDNAVAISALIEHAKSIAANPEYDLSPKLDFSITEVTIPAGAYYHSMLDIDGISLHIKGDNTYMYCDSAISVQSGRDEYLTGAGQALGKFTLMLDNITFIQLNPAATIYKNKGFRRFELRDCALLHGAVGADVTWCWAQCRITNCRFQYQTDTKLLVREKSNLLKIEKSFFLSGGGVGIRLDTSLRVGSASELNGVQIDQCDIEGCETGIILRGQNINCTNINAWCEGNTGNAILIDDSDDGNIRGTVISGSYDSDIVIGVNSPAGIGETTVTDGTLLLGAKIISAQNDQSVHIGLVTQMGASATIELPSSTLVNMAGRTAIRYPSQPQVPLKPSSFGSVGDVRWDNGAGYINTDNGWRKFQTSTFGAGTKTITELPKSYIQLQENRSLIIIDSTDITIAGFSGVSDATDCSRITLLFKQDGVVINGGAFVNNSSILRPSANSVMECMVYKESASDSGVILLSHLVM